MVVPISPQKCKNSQKIEVKKVIENSALYKTVNSTISQSHYQTCRTIYGWIWHRSGHVKWIPAVATPAPVQRRNRRDTGEKMRAISDSVRARSGRTDNAICADLPGRATAADCRLLLNVHCRSCNTETIYSDPNLQMKWRKSKRVHSKVRKVK